MTSLKTHCGDVRLESESVVNVTCVVKSPEYLLSILNLIPGLLVRLSAQMNFIVPNYERHVSNSSARQAGVHCWSEGLPLSLSPPFIDRREGERNRGEWG